MKWREIPRASVFLQDMYKTSVSPLPDDPSFIAGRPLGLKVNVDTKFMVMGALNSPAVFPMRKYS